MPRAKIRMLNLKMCYKYKVVNNRTYQSNKLKKYHKNALVCFPAKIIFIVCTVVLILLLVCNIGRTASGEVVPGEDYLSHAPFLSNPFSKGYMLLCASEGI